MVAEGEPVDPLGIWLRKISSNTPPMKEAISCYNKDDVFVGREYHNTHELNETIPADKFEYYFQFIMYSLITFFFIFTTYRIYKQKKFGLIPFLSLWMLFEIGYKFYLVPGRGLVLSLLFTVVAINSFRGWLGIRRYQKT